MNSPLGAAGRPDAAPSATAVPRRRLLIAAAIVVTLAYGMTLLDRAALDTLLREDGVVEWVGALLLLLAGVLSFACFLRARRAAAAGEATRLLPVAYLLLGLVFVFGAGEEIAWGSRLFGWKSEAIQQANAQNETTIHNLTPLQDTLLNHQRLFAMFWIGFAVLLPLAFAASARVRNLVRGRIPVAPLVVAPLFILNQVVSELVERLLPASLYHGAFHLPMATVETRETNFALLFALTAFLMFERLGRRPAAAEDQAPGARAREDRTPAPELSHAAG